MTFKLINASHPPHFIMSTAVFTFLSNNLTADTWALVADPSNNDLLKAYKMAFASVVVTKVVVTLNVAKEDNLVIRYGLFRSLAGVPTDLTGLCKVPFLQTVISDSDTARSHCTVFHPGDAPAEMDGRSHVAVPGLEWDLRQTAIRSGHPHVILGLERTGGIGAASGTAVVANAQIEYHVTLGGIGAGY
jgi:hypothetical protein